LPKRAGSLISPRKVRIMAAKSCSSCGHAELETGFMLNSAGSGYGRWVRGELEVGILGGARPSGKPQFDVQAYRCTRCSHLELFAADALY
jgi:hypothetical protein